VDLTAGGPQSASVSSPSSRDRLLPAAGVGVIGTAVASGDFGVPAAERWNLPNPFERGVLAGAALEFD